MAKTGDVLAAMRRNPAGDWTIEDIRRVCERCGLQCLAPLRGSHWKVAARGRPDILSIPARRPIKPFYIRKFVAMCDEAEN
jgi:hypothetical protein